MHSCRVDLCYHRSVFGTFDVSFDVKRWEYIYLVTADLVTTENQPRLYSAKTSLIMVIVENIRNLV